MDMTMEAPENNLGEISAKSAWNPACQELKALKPVFEEARQKGSASLGTVLQCIRNLKEEPPSDDPSIQNVRGTAIERIENFLHKNKLEPKLEDLKKLKKGLEDNDLILRDAHKYPQEWKADAKTVEAYRKESKEISEKIWYIEHTPEYAEHLLELEAKDRLAWEKTLEQLTPDERELVQVETKIFSLKESLQAIAKDEDWKQEAERDGSYKKMGEDLALLRELRDSPEHEAAKEQAANLFRDLRKKLRVS